MPVFPLILTIFFCSISLSLSQPSPPRGTFINCGATSPSTISGRQWLPDLGFVSQGTPKNLSISVLSPILSTVRSFPVTKNVLVKFCYVVPVFRGAKYMVRTTYFYGGVNGNDSPPVFDQILDGTLWSVVNTTEDYANGMSSYYEGVFIAQGKTMSLCIGANSYTESDPFISALEFVILGGSLYNSTNFKQNGLSLIARHSFGYNGSIIRFPDDQFDRFWEPFGENDISVSKNGNVSVSGIWNLPPAKVFQTELTTGQSGGALVLKWPAAPLQNSTYYIALYFADDRSSSDAPERLLNVSINGFTYYSNLSVSQEGSSVFATQWPLSGPMTVNLTAFDDSSVPLINAGEIFEILALGGRTLTRDVSSMEQVKNSFQNPPHDWSGDPCMPRQYSWTGVTCSEGPRIRVISLNLTGMSLSGSLSPSIAKITALKDIRLGNNNLTGSLPDFSTLKMLQTLHLEDNQFNGGIPSSLGNIKNLRELFLQNNNLTGQIPNNLIGKPGLDLRTTGNQLISPPPS